MTVIISVLICIFFIFAGYAGLVTQNWLQPEHKTGETKGVIAQISGVISLLLALVLGTLIGVSFAYYSGQRTNLENFSAQVLRLDQALAQFGPETQPARDKLKEGISKGYDVFWGAGVVDHSDLTVGKPLMDARMISDYLGTLQPKTDMQKAALATAQQYASLVEQSRLLMSLQSAAGPVSWFLIAVLAFWTAALFFGIGLYADTNRLVYAAMTLGSVSIAFAIFLIFEFGQPYTGMFPITPAALEQTIQYMGK